MQSLWFRALGSLGIISPFSRYRILVKGVAWANLSSDTPYGFLSLPDIRTPHPLKLDVAVVLDRGSF